MYPLDPFTRLVSGYVHIPLLRSFFSSLILHGGLSSLVSTALHGLPVVCTSDEFQTFTAPAGQTCRQWAGEYADLVGGYLNNPDSTSVCEFCE
jgi:ABC-type multidrug transport system permease subunit